MIVFILLLTLATALVVGSAWRYVDAASSRGASGSTLLTSTIGVITGLVLAFVALGFAEVPAGHVGVVTSFGKIHEGTLGPGLQWNVPLVNNVSTMDTRIQVYSFEGVEGASSDLQAVNLTGIVNFHLDPAAASSIFQNVGTDYKDKVFTRPADTILKSVTPRFRAADIVGQRVEIGRLTAEALTAEVTRYGIIVDGVSISNIGLSADFLKAIEDKVRAEQEAAKERQLIEVSKAQAQQQIERANGEAESQRIRAQGQADSNALLTQSLTDEVIQWQYINTLNPNVDVIYLPTGNQFILPLPQPGQPSTPPTTP